MMNRIACGALVALLALAGGGCKREGGAGGTGKFRVALILPGREQDGAWNQLAVEGLERIKAELGADVSKVTNVGTSEFAKQVKNYAEDGYDVVICHGGEFSAIVKDVAATYPKTRFIVGGSDVMIPGAVTVEFQLRDASYVAGRLAAEVTKTNQATFVGAMPYATVRACSVGFGEGLAASGKTIGFNDLWTNSWDDAAKAKEQTELAIGTRNADVIYQNVDAGARGVFQAVQEAKAKGKTVWAFGCNRDQNALAPDVVLGSVVIDVPKAYLDVAREAKDGKWNPRAAKLGLAEGYVDLVLNDKHPLVTKETRALVDAARKARGGGGAATAPATTRAVP